MQQMMRSVAKSGCAGERTMGANVFCHGFVGEAIGDLFIAAVRAFFPRGVSGIRTPLPLRAVSSYMAPAEPAHRKKTF